MNSCLALLLALCGLFAAASATYYPPFHCPYKYPLGPGKKISTCKRHCPDNPSKCLKGNCYPKVYYRNGHKYKCWKCVQKILPYYDGDKCCSDYLHCPSTPPESCYDYECQDAGYGWKTCKKVVKYSPDHEKRYAPSYTTCCDPSNDLCDHGYHCDPYSFKCKKY